MQTTSKECKSCENFDLSTNMCLQHNEMGYDCDKHCSHIGCKDWIQCSGFVPDMSEPDVDCLRFKADKLNKIVDIVNNTDSFWDCDVKAAYMEIEKIVKNDLQAKIDDNLQKEKERYIVFPRTNLSKKFKADSIDTVIYHINGQKSVGTYAFAYDRIKSQLENADVAMFHDYYIIKL